MDTKRIIQNCKDKLGRTVYVVPDIPDRQLSGALNGITGAMVPKETVVAVVDTSAMEVFDSGLVFTEDALYCKTLLSELVRIEYGDIGRTKIYSSMPGKLAIMDKTGKVIHEFPGSNLKLDAVAKLLETLATAAGEDAGKDGMSGDESEETAEKRRCRFERVWADLDRSSRRWLIVGIVLCCTGVGIFWGIASIVVGYWFLKKRQEDVALLDSGLPSDIYEADVKELRSSVWQNVLLVTGTFGIVDMCGKSRRRMEAMADAVNGLTVLPQEDIIQRYAEAFAARADHLPFFLKGYDARVSNFDILDFQMALFSKGSKFNLRNFHPRRYLWVTRAKTDSLARKYVRGQLARMEKQGEILRIRVGGTVFAFTPSGFRAAAERTESIVGSTDRVSWEELADRLRDVAPMDAREAGLFAEAAGIGVRTYFFADGRHCITRANTERVEICPACGTAFGRGEGCEGFCSDYCRATNESCGDAIRELWAQRTERSKAVLPAGTEIVKTGEGLMGAASGMKSAAVFGSGLAVGMLGKFAGAAVLGFLPGGVFIGGLLGRSIGKKLGKLIAKTGTECLEDDHAIAAITAVYDEFGILATLFHLNFAEINQVAVALNKQMGENGNFADEVYSKGEWRRQHVARLLLPILGKACKGVTPLSGNGSAPKSLDGNSDSVERVHDNEM